MFVDLLRHKKPVHFDPATNSLHLGVEPVGESE